MLSLSGKVRNKVRAATGIFTTDEPAKGRVALLGGCAQSVLDGEINNATISLLNRLGVDVVVPKSDGCCGSLVHHMGRKEQAISQAKHMIDLWCDLLEDGGLDAIVITTSGCGVLIKDYKHLFRNDSEYRQKAERVAALALDISEYLTTLSFPAPQDHAANMTIAYHAACSLQHGQKITDAPKQLLQTAGFQVLEPDNSHICCGSAGVYNILQSDIASQLGEQKIKNLMALNPQAIVSGNIGCLKQLDLNGEIPVLHLVKLLNWAYGGESPTEFL